MAERSPYVVRPPVPLDAEALGRVHCRVWQETYAGSMSAQTYAALSPERFARGWRQRLAAAADGGRRCLGAGGR
ncbi:MAG: hypothetical protein ACR2FV_11200 [Ornithinimicrobium sp.]|uniref:hypothetical protein n=1 Tax=Ornithinimicrobium sp. TaxID=1977084 RepID=UPI003D9B6FB2